MNLTDSRRSQRDREERFHGDWRRKIKNQHSGNEAKTRLGSQSSEQTPPPPPTCEEDPRWCREGTEKCRPRGLTLDP